MQFYVQQLVIGAVLLAGVLLAFYFGINVVDGNYQVILMFIGLSCVLALFGMIKDNAWVLLPIAVVVPWKFNFLPGKFTFFEFAILAGTAFYCASYLSIQKKMPRVGPVWVWFPFVILFSIIMYHWYMGGIGMNLLGGETFGARRNLSFIFAIMAFTLILTLRKGDMKSLKQLPFYYALAALVSVIPIYVTTFFPSTSGFVFNIFGTYDSSAYQEMLTGEAADVGVKRQGELASFTAALQVLLICKYRITTWWHPGRIWIPVVSLLCFYGTLQSGYRGSVFVYVVLSAIAAVMTIRWKCFPFVVMGLITVSVLTIGQNRVFSLPQSMQRSLSFLPGEWDDAVIQSTKSSNDFRDNMKKVYLDQFAHKSPWIGTGFQFDPGQFMNKVIETSESGEAQVYGFIVRKDYHVGWISVYDTTGLIGSAAFLALCLVFLFSAVKFIVCHANPEPVQVWACAYIITEIVTYFVTFGALQITIVRLAVYGAILFVVTNDLTKYEKEQREKRLNEAQGVNA